jgi:hypothetical protein
MRAWIKMADRLHKSHSQLFKEPLIGILAYAYLTNGQIPPYNMHGPSPAKSSERLQAA